MCEAKAGELAPRPSQPGSSLKFTQSMGPFDGHRAALPLEMNHTRRAFDTNSPPVNVMSRELTVNSLTPPPKM